MEKNEQELRRYLRKRIDDYCRGKLCNECDVRETCYSGCPLSSELSTSKLQEIYCAMYPDMKSMHDDWQAHLQKEFAKVFVPTADQRAKADEGKIDLTLVPRQIVYDIAEVREYGNKKYGDPDNWKTVEIERYRKALYRHFFAYLDDPDGKDESGLEHYKHMACNMAFICALEAERRANNR